MVRKALVGMVSVLFVQKPAWNMCLWLETHLAWKCLHQEAGHVRNKCIAAERQAAQALLLHWEAVWRGCYRKEEQRAYDALSAKVCACALGLSGGAALPLPARHKGRQGPTWGGITGLGPLQRTGNKSFGRESKSGFEGCGSSSATVTHVP